VIPFTLSRSDSLPLPAINPITALNVTPAANSEQLIFNILLLIPDGIFAYLNKGTRARTGKRGQIMRQGRVQEERGQEQRPTITRRDEREHQKYGTEQKTTERTGVLIFQQ
jgi:hypothetical protein